jgi:hypothetical protein
MSIQERFRAILTKRHDYRGTFGADAERTKAQEKVLLDLARFCYAYKPTTMKSPMGTVDPIASAVAEGRRQVWLRIAGLLQTSDSAILQALEREQHE